MRTNRKIAIMVILFAVSAFTLAGKVLMPTPIQIVIQGEEPIVVGQIFRYTQIDVTIISVSAVILAISSFYLLFVSSIETRTVLPTAEEKDTSEFEIAFALRLLDGDKRKLFNEIVEAGGETLPPLLTQGSSAGKLPDRCPQLLTKLLARFRRASKPHDHEALLQQAVTLQVAKCRD